MLQRGDAEDGATTVTEMEAAVVEFGLAEH